MSIIEKNFSKVNELIISALKSDVALINQLANYIILAGGKRLRPKLVLLAANACGYQGDDHIKLATIIEFIHTATLLHDDVVDESNMRRGRDTANEIFGNQAAVLTGDFLYSRSFQIMVEIDNMQVMQILSNTTNVIAEGEVMQLMNINDPDISEAQYMEVIYRKTGKLFESATELGAVITNSSPQTQVALKKYGKHLGNAFQIVDDILDFKSNDTDMGKNTGDDLAEGKITLPLIHAMQVGSQTQQDLIRQAIVNEQADKLSKINTIISETGSDKYCIEQANNQVALAIEAIAVLPKSDYQAELINIANKSVNRTS